MITQNKQEISKFIFEDDWLEIILTKNVLNREDLLLLLLKKFNIKFFDKNWEESLPTKEMGRVLINDAPKDELLIAVKKLLQNYSELLSFDESKKVFDVFRDLDSKLLYKIFLNISSNKGLAELSKGRQSKNETNKDDLLFWLMQEFYGVGDVV